MALVAVGVVAVGLGAWWVVGRGAGSPSSTAATPPVASGSRATTPPKVAAPPPVVEKPNTGATPAGRIVTVKISSRPPGARLLRAADGVLLGVTPLALEMKAAGAPLEVRVEKEGFTTITRSLALDRDVSDEVILEKKKDEHRPGKKPPARHGDDEPAKL